MIHLNKIKNYIIDKSIKISQVEYFYESIIGEMFNMCFIRLVIENI
jgi:uncharacterized membrane protein